MMIIRDQLQAGIIETFNPDSTNGVAGARSPSDDLPIHYLPDHGVVQQESQMTKLRIVYDGWVRALGDQYSLNNCLQQAPNCIPNLLNI